MRDSHDETFGSISGLWADASSWRRSGDTCTGSFIAAPDRGYNITGTIDYAPRLNTLEMVFAPASRLATCLAHSQIGLTLAQSTRRFETLPGGGTQLLSGLDPVPGGVATGGARPAAGGMPELPQAFNGKLALDAAAIVVLPDGSRLVSDEYGPSIYRFSPAGQFLGALPVAASVRPLRDSVTDYSSNNPATLQPAPSPANPTYGRSNKQGFEGFTVSPDGCTLSVALQSAARQDGASSSAANRNHTRLFTYDISNLDRIALEGEYVVKLPRFTQGASTLVAAQSEILAVSDQQLMIPPRDSNGQNVGTQ
ncbi:MAG: esterase-like activity of phytase family protein [Rubrivivax sp.]|nr:esterase-like activity of phytase family protein [Rubrivivax sp.]